MSERHSPTCPLCLSGEAAWTHNDREPVFLDEPPPLRKRFLVIAKDYRTYEYWRHVHNWSTKEAVYVKGKQDLRGWEQGIEVRFLTGGLPAWFDHEARQILEVLKARALT